MLLPIIDDIVYRLPHVASFHQLVELHPQLTCPTLNISQTKNNGVVTMPL